MIKTTMLCIWNNNNIIVCNPGTNAMLELVVVVVCKRSESVIFNASSPHKIFWTEVKVD